LYHVNRLFIYDQHNNINKNTDFFLFLLKQLIIVAIIVILFFSRVYQSTFIYLTFQFKSSFSLLSFIYILYYSTYQQYNSNFLLSLHFTIIFYFDDYLISIKIKIAKYSFYKIFIFLFLLLLVSGSRRPF